MHKDNALYFKTILKNIFCMMIFHDNCAYFHFNFLFPIIQYCKGIFILLYITFKYCNAIIIYIYFFNIALQYWVNVINVTMQKYSMF